MPGKNVVSFTTMIDGYAKAGDMTTVRFLFDPSLEKDVKTYLRTDVATTTPTKRTMKAMQVTIHHEPREGGPQ
ncbi:hypothetical protein JHK87_057241 [Glycine soja]|nr:hypothetical protein JHK87_057241 [Glycine soja]